MNRVGFGARPTGVQSSPCSTDEEGWSSDEPLETSLQPSFQHYSVFDRVTQSSSDGHEKISDGNLEAHNLGTESQDQNKNQAYRTASHRMPLVESIQNEWHTRSQARVHSGPDENVPNPRQVLPAPKLGRWDLLCLILFCLLWANWKWWARAKWHEHILIRNVVIGKFKPGYSTNMRPEFLNMILLKDLDHVPDRERSRLIIIGDVHGCIDELLSLLVEVSYNADHDHVIFAGDMINKGPSSRAVVNLIMSMGASCVRGNHEDRMLRTYHHMKSHGLLRKGISKTEHRSSNSGPGNLKKHQNTDTTKPRRGESADRELASSFSKKQIEYLSSCPVILRLGPIPGMGQVLVVHGGLVPGVELEKQDPVEVMNMRTLDLETWVSSRSANGIAWNTLWNKYQTYLPKPKRSTVIYGHDSRRGLQLTKYTKGLDTGCVKGGKLTALVIKFDGTEPVVASVQGKDYRTRTEL